MKVLQKFISSDFPFQWSDIDYYPNSNGSKKEIYLKDDEGISEKLLEMFDLLFGHLKNEMLLYCPSWWDFCIDTWNIEKDDYDYGLLHKSAESKTYINMLSRSMIEIGYSGSCKCNNWKAFLSVTIDCIVKNQALYSHIFYEVKNNFFFYFHHTGSLGLYYHKSNKQIDNILSEADRLYILK